MSLISDKNEPKFQPPAEANSCRLCGGDSSLVFRKTNMYKYDISYFRCTRCGSLQTEKPWWLEEAYANPVRYTDTFGGYRSSQMPVLVYFLAKILGIPVDCQILDWGGGDGLMTRRMRDLGFDARSYDMYEKCTYAAGFEGSTSDKPEIITAIEVLEHMASPSEELGSLLGLGAKVIFATTCLYSDQKEDWAYLAPYSGRHVFFYSETGLRIFAGKFGYSCLFYGDNIVIYKDEHSGIKKKLLGYLFTNSGRRLALAYVALFPPEGRTRSDWQLMRENVRDV